jgi:hypothetical protein
MKKTRAHMCAAKSIACTVMLSLMGFIGFAAVSSVNGRAAGYTYTKIAALGETAPGGAQYFFDFEPGQINDRGDVIYVADLSKDGVNDIGEGVFLLSHGQIIALSLPGDPAPSGGTFFGAAFTPAGVNAEGDAAAAIALQPFTLPLGMNAGLYRYSAAKKLLTAVVVPGVTAAPGTGGTFQGVSFETSINNTGDICFAGIIATDSGILPAQGLGMGIFVANKAGQISSVVMPGDSAPGGGRFDFAEIAYINARGDVGFGAHIAGEECVGDPNLENQSTRIMCGDNVYLRKAPSGEIISIAHQGDPAPGGGVFRHAWGPILNNDHQLLFVGDLTPPPDNDLSQGLYLFNGSFTVPVVRPGDALPDGTLKTVSDFVNGHHLNNPGEISFLAELTTGDEAIYVKSGNTFRLVAKRGTNVPGVGTIANFDTAGGTLLNGGAVNNDRGQVMFSANLVGGGAALIVATPMP